jgi:NAD(P)-dependent dehydrogenase (short-subunit alcohol dehydrogenase family)
MSKIVLVTEANIGIGLSIARMLSQQGHTVYATHSQLLEGGKLKGVIQLPLDLRNDTDVRQCLDDIVQRSGRLDVVVNCSHHELLGSIEGTTISEVRDLFETNFFGTFNVCHCAVPYLRDSGGGYIINVMSMNAQFPMPFQAVYAAAQSAIDSLTQSLSVEVKQFNIKVVLLEIGEFKDDLESSQIPTVAASPNSYGHQVFRVMQQLTRRKNKALNSDALGYLVGAIILNPKPSLRYSTHKLRHFVVLSMKFLLPGRILEKYILWRFKIPTRPKKKSDD